MKLAAVGSNCVDYYRNIENGKAYPGGGPVNMAVYTVRLGGQSSYIGPVGDDVYGEIMRKAIEAKGVDISHLHVKPGKTAVTQVELIDGEQGQYGLYVKTVNGIEADADKDQAYWAFYVNGEYATYGVDLTEIIDGDSYAFKYETI